MATRIGYGTSTVTDGSASGLASAGTAGDEEAVEDEADEDIDMDRWLLPRPPRVRNPLTTLRLRVFLAVEVLVTAPDCAEFELWVEATLTDGELSVVSKAAWTVDRAEGG
ncbi:hypothetical protein BGZ75_001427 [Mortierella antarctica]|nr:hypothetical protein BGZ75_001427 [Mortierella antarctica]